MARFFSGLSLTVALAVSFAGCRKGPDEPCSVETSGEQGPCRGGLACYKGKCASREDVSAASGKARETAVASESEGKHDEALRLLSGYADIDGWGTSFRASVELMKQFDAKGIAFVKAMDGMRAVNNAGPDPADEEATAEWKKTLGLARDKAKAAHSQVMESMPLLLKALESCPD
ncbi:MAG: hypothetical protein ABIJ56_13530, partial [Pseudomonadota bacterium]